MMNLKKYKISDESLEEEADFPSMINTEKSLTESKFNTQNIPNSSKQITNKTKVIDDSMFNNPNFNADALSNSELLVNEDLSVNFKNPYANPLKEINLDKELQLNSDNLNYHHPQIIDEDVENFKRRLDITLKNFRTDTLKEFMTIKRHLLVEQKSVIDSEKQKCDALLSAKIDQIEHLKESLAKTKNALTIESEIKEKMANSLFKIKHSKYSKKLKTAAFTNCLLKFHKQKKKNKLVFNKIRQNLILKLKSKAFKGIKSNYTEMKTVNLISAKEKEFTNKLNEMSQYYGKEINDLRMKLNEANQTVESFKNSKNLIQENLKKALMRGVVAMNLEAMNVLEDDPNNINFNMFENLNVKPNSSVITNANHNNVKTSTETSNSNPNREITTSFNPLKEERKVVVKDNNWVNACAVPSKMKSNIISNNNFEFEEEKEIPTFTPLPINIRTEYEPISDYHSELTKNLSNIRSEFGNILKSNTNNNVNPIMNYPHYSNLNDSEYSQNSSNFESSFLRNNVNVNVNVNPNSSQLLNNILVTNKNEEKFVENNNNTTGTGVSYVSTNNVSASRKNINLPNNTNNNVNTSINSANKPTVKKTNPSQPQTKSTIKKTSLK